MSFISQLDETILLFAQEHLRSFLLTPAMIFLSGLGTAGIIWIALGILLLAFKKTRFGGVALLITLGLSWVVNDCVFKPIFQRPRPYLVIRELLPLVPRRTDFSFPSGHTATAFASAYALTRLLDKRWAWIYILSALIAFSRIYLGMHYPTDVLGAILTGTLTAAVLCPLMETYLKPLFQKSRK